jgi:hypothetical protein
MPQLCMPPALMACQVVAGSPDGLGSNGGAGDIASSSAVSDNPAVGVIVPVRPVGGAVSVGLAASPEVVTTTTNNETNIDKNMGFMAFSIRTYSLTG